MSKVDSYTAGVKEADLADSFEIWLRSLRILSLPSLQRWMLIDIPDLGLRLVGEKWRIDFNHILLHINYS